MNLFNYVVNHLNVIKRENIFQLIKSLFSEIEKQNAICTAQNKSSDRKKNK